MTGDAATTRRAVRVDLEGGAFKADPGPTFAALRARGPLVRIRLPLVGAVWATTTHAATRAVVEDNALFVQEGRHAGRSGIPGMQWWMPRRLALLANSMLTKDEPDHRRLRRLVDGAFGRRGVLHMRGQIAAMADRLLDQIEPDGDGEVELVASFAARLPLAVIGALLGLPETEHSRFSQAARPMLQARGPLSFLSALRSIDTLAGYVRERIAVERRAPAAVGLIAELVRDEAADALDESELISMVLLLLIAGFETTTHLISGSVRALEAHPAQKAELLADPAGRIELAVEELARFVSPVQMTKPRFVARDAQVLGAELKRGELAVALLAAANADPAAFEAPERLDLARLPNPHLAFSSGVHFCLGMQLARLETQVALERLYARFPQLSIPAPEQLVWRPRLGVRGLKALPARLGSRPLSAAAHGLGR